MLDQQGAGANSFAGTGNVKGGDYSCAWFFSNRLSLVHHSFRRRTKQIGVYWIFSEMISD